MKNLRMFKLLTGIDIVGDVKSETPLGYLIENPLRFVDTPGMELYFCGYAAYTKNKTIFLKQEHVIWGPNEIFPEMETMYDLFLEIIFKYADIPGIINKSVTIAREFKTAKEAGDRIDNAEDVYPNDTLSEEEKESILQTFKIKNKKRAN